MLLFADHESRIRRWPSGDSLTHEREYEAATRTFFSRTPEGRTATIAIDAQGRVVEWAPASLTPVQRSFSLVRQYWEHRNCSRWRRDWSRHGRRNGGGCRKDGADSAGSEVVTISGMAPAAVGGAMGLTVGRSSRK